MEMIGIWHLFTSGTNWCAIHERGFTLQSGLVIKGNILLKGEGEASMKDLKSFWEYSDTNVTM